MFELIILIVTIWLGCKVLGLLFKTAWGLTKIMASVLFALAIPLLIFCLFFAAGVLLVIPVCMIAVALGLLRKIV